MALIKGIETRQGVLASYWRVLIVTHDWGRDTVTVTVGGYVDRSIRMAGYEPLVRERVTVTGDPVARYFAGGDPRTGAYACLRTHFPPLADAVDDDAHNAPSALEQLAARYRSDR